ncbi:ACT domain-containing protein [Moorellaceae bacterium AZ2]
MGGQGKAYKAFDTEGHPLKRRNGAGGQGTSTLERISIFAISTYDTDYLLVKEEQFDLAIRVLKQSGHHIE